MLTLLAYRAFIDPLPIGNGRGWIGLVVPLVVLVAVAYKTIKLPDLRQLPRQATVLALQIYIFMAAAAAAIWVLNIFL